MRLSDRIICMRKSLILLLFVLCFTACTIPHITPTETPTPEPTATETPIPEPTPTTPPAAAKVNGLYIAIEDVDCRSAQLRDAYEQLGKNVPGNDELREEALNDLIDETLFLSAAQLRGISPTAADLESKKQELCESLGSCDALYNWQNRNHYTEASFQRALERETAASNMRETIFASLKDAEQLHVYRIWSDRRSDLTEAQNRLNLGISFIDVARNYDVATGGDMNWFPRGVLFSGELEEKIFSLNTGEYTDILEADGVYNIFYVADKQTGREMEMQVQQIAQRKALSDWLEEQRKQAEIEIL